MIHPLEVKEVSAGAEYKLPTYFVTNEGLQDGIPITIKYCKGNKADNFVFRQQGILPESVLALTIMHLKAVNQGDLADEDTANAIAHLEAAAKALADRQEKRKQRGVEGTYKK